MNNNYWEELAKSLVSKYKDIMFKRHFKYEDTNLAYIRCFKFETLEEERRYKEASNLRSIMIEDTNTIPKNYIAWIVSTLKKLR